MARSKNKEHYFDNAAVEAVLTRYVEGGCTDVALRDEIMVHAVTLIRNVIHSTNLASIVQCQHAVSLDDLASVAWVQVEKTLYKFQPGRAKAFSMWTQIVYTSCLAHIKKQTRDSVRVRAWQNGSPAPRFDKHEKPDFYKIMAELREAVQPEYQDLVDAVVELYETDSRPWMGLVKKLGAMHGRAKTRKFLQHLRTLDVSL